MSACLYNEVKYDLSESRLTRQQYAELSAEAVVTELSGERLLTTQAMTLLIRIDRDRKEARAQFNQDWFRRLMRLRNTTVRRLRRRWNLVQPTPSLPLGQLCRRYHANLCRHLYEPMDR